MLCFVAFSAIAQVTMPKIILLDTTNTNYKWQYISSKITDIEFVDSTDVNYISVNRSSITFLVIKRKVVVGDTLYRRETYTLPLSVAPNKVWALYNDVGIKRQLKKDIKEKSILKKLNEE